jgi:S-DNA-T family DNA segregation ATPase FtsK/SpoIIIE
MPMCVVAPRRSPLRTFLSSPDMIGVTGGPGVTLLTDSDALAGELPAAVEAAEGRLALVIDDAEMLLDNPVSGRLDRIVRAAADRDGLVILAGTTSDLVRRFSGWIFDARQARTGIILQPAGPADGDVFDLRLPRSTGSLPQPAGRGILVVRGVPRPAQIVTDDDAQPVGTPPPTTGLHP